MKRKISPFSVILTPADRAALRVIASHRERLPGDALRQILREEAARLGLRQAPAEALMEPARPAELETV